MVESRSVQCSHDRPYRSSPGLSSSIHHGTYTSMNERAGTHQAGFHRHVKRGPSQPIITNRSSGRTQRHDLSMRSRVNCVDRLITSCANQLSAVNNNSTSPEPRASCLHGPKIRLHHPSVMGVTVQSTCVLYFVLSYLIVLQWPRPRSPTKRSCR